jgi:hypothetical protein
MSTEAVLLAAHRLIDPYPNGLSWGNPATRHDMSRMLAPWDSAARAEAMASEQSNCALAVAAALLIAEVDGTVPAWRGRKSIDPLREPRWGHYDSPAYLEQLAIARGLRRVCGQDPPDLRPGVYWRVGGGAALGGEAHVGMVLEGPDADGRIVCLEGGKRDQLNPRPGSKGCTRIERTVQRLSGRPGRWILAGRVLGYTADAGAMPCVASGERKGMPWKAIGVEPCP